MNFMTIPYTQAMALKNTLNRWKMSKNALDLLCATCNIFIRVLIRAHVDELLKEQLSRLLFSFDFHISPSHAVWNFRSLLFTLSNVFIDMRRKWEPFVNYVHMPVL
jgi:hypothetical protein